MLRPLLQSLRDWDNKARLLKVGELERQIEKNMEQKQMLTNLMAGGYLEPALFNKESNSLVVKAAELRQEKESLMHSISGDMKKADELQGLLKFASKRAILTEFDDEIFLKYVEGITVQSRSKVTFELKCGLCLRERLVD